MSYDLLWRSAQSSPVSVLLPACYNDDFAHTLGKFHTLEGEYGIDRLKIIEIKFNTRLSNNGSLILIDEVFSFIVWLYGARKLKNLSYKLLSIVILFYTFQIVFIFTKD